MLNTSRKTNLSRRWIETKKVLAIVFIFAFAALLLLHYFYGVREIPFHPDEATRMYSAQDFTRLLRDPFDLAWNPDNANDPLLRYRLIDSPMINYIIGFGLLISGEKIPNIDWDWSKTWAENAAAGALPSSRTLFVSRMAVALWFIVTLGLAFLISKNLHGYLAGIIALIFAGTNSLYLLHTRRAMAEGALLAGIYLVLYLLPKANKYPLLIGAAASLAICTKQSALPVAIVAGIAVIWPLGTGDDLSYKKIKQVAWKFFQFSGAFLITFILLNPVYWKHPLQAVKASLFERQRLIMAQTADFGNNSLMAAPGKSILGVIANTYILPPSFAETTQYGPNTAASEIFYLSDPFNQAFRGTLGGGIFLCLTISGIIIAIISYNKINIAQRRVSSLYLLAGFAQLIFTLIFLPIPWQRYVIPLIPYAILWSSLVVATPLLRINKITRIQDNTNSS